MRKTNFILIFLMSTMAASISLAGDYLDLELRRVPSNDWGYRNLSNEGQAVFSQFHQKIQEKIDQKTAGTDGPLVHAYQRYYFEPSKDSKGGILETLTILPTGALRRETIQLPESNVPTTKYSITPWGIKQGSDRQGQVRRTFATDSGTLSIDESYVAEKFKTGNFRLQYFHERINPDNSAGELYSRGNVEREVNVKIKQDTKRLFAGTLSLSDDIQGIIAGYKFNPELSRIIVHVLDDSKPQITEYEYWWCKKVCVNSDYAKG